ncbi:MAG: ABC transporter ATP-binding protein [Eubacteriales bacterium]|nr:ABC transporter ATP-binding protein [Eubacteriales bacterium]
MITVKKLRFTYPGASQEVLTGMDFHVGRSEIFGFLGPSGAGKSTAQKILTGILKGYAGSVHVLGDEVRRKKRDYYERIGVVMEVPNLYGKLTAMENLRYFASLYQAPCGDAAALMERLELAQDINTRVSGYSKGMKMRLNFIRAIQHRPDVLFLDEPTAGLDPARSRIIKDMILEQKASGVTVLLTTHDMHLAEDLCDRVAFIVDGSIRLLDTPINLRLRAGERRVRYTWQEKTRHEAETPLKSLKDDAQFLRLMKERRLETLHTQEPSLEDLFIQETGRRLT